jgi:hypothetical protein
VSAPASPNKPRGLASVAQAKEDRARAKGRATPQFILLAATLCVCGLIAYKVVTDRDVNRAKDRILADQRAAVQSIGAEWFPMRDKIEQTVVAAAAEYKGDFVDPSARAMPFRGQPGLYLRLRVVDAKDTAAIRKNAPDSQKDAFAGCFLREPNDRAARGEADAGAFAEQPWNLGRAYASARVLTEEWANNVREATDLIRIKVFDQQLEKAMQEELPLAARVVKNAQFFLLALDEDSPEATKLADGGAVTEAQLQLVPHATRVVVLDLRSGKELLRVRRAGAAMLLPAGERVVTDPALKDSMARQANNCNLAQQIEAAITQSAP